MRCLLFVGVKRISEELEVFRYQTVGGSLPSLFVLLGENCDECRSLLMERFTKLPSSVAIRKYYFEYVFPYVARRVQTAPVRWECHDLDVMREKQKNSDTQDDKKIQARTHAKDFESIESLERYIQHSTVYAFFKPTAGNYSESGEEDVVNLDNDYIGDMSNQFTRLRGIHWENVEDFESTESLKDIYKHTTVIRKQGKQMFNNRAGYCVGDLSNRFT